MAVPINNAITELDFSLSNMVTWLGKAWASDLKAWVSELSACAFLECKLLYFVVPRC